VVVHPPEAPLFALEVVVDHCRDEHLSAPDLLGEEPPLGDFGLAALVDLDGQTFAPDSLAVLPPMLVGRGAFLDPSQ
jgi:hypothetical protein